MIEYLTGPPKINGFTFPYGQNGNEWTPEWEQEAVRFAGRTRSQTRWRRVRPVIAPQWAFIELEDYAALAREMQAPEPILVTPATWAEGDPNWAKDLVQTYECQVEVPLRPGRKLSGGRREVSFKLKGQVWHSRRPDVLTGDFALTAETA